MSEEIKCLRCGRDGHLAEDCKLPVLPDGRVLVSAPPAQQAQTEWVPTCVPGECKTVDLCKVECQCLIRNIQPTQAQPTDTERAYLIGFADGKQAQAEAAITSENGKPASQGASAITSAGVPSDMVLVSVKELTRWRDAFAEELAAWDIDPPLHHVKTSHDEIGALIAKMGATP